MISVQNALHIEVCSGVDGVEQGPLMSQRNILVAQFAFDRAERRHHNRPPQSLRRRGFFAIVTARRDDFPVGDIRL